MRPTGRQPLLHDLTVTLTAPTVVLSRPDGDLDAAVAGGGVQGLFHADVRALSLLRVTVRGLPDGGAAAAEDVPWWPVEPVLAVADGPGRSRFVGLARALGDDVPDPTVRLDRDRTVSPGRLDERITVRSSAIRPVRLAVRVELAGDLVTLEHAKAGRPAGAAVGSAIAAGRTDAAGEPVVRSAGRPVPGADGRPALGWGDGTVSVAVHAPGAVADAGAGTLVWELTVAPDSAADLGFVVEVRDPGAAVLAAGPAPTWRRPQVTADDRRLTALLEQSLDDLESLRMATADRPDDTFLAAGAPWFFTLFGRDSLWAARLMLPLGTELALGTLHTLAARQGVRSDPEAEEEPGKILHELRRGVFDDGSGLRLPPAYYGTVDATPLWVCLLHDAWRWGLRAQDVEPLLPALVAALDWVRAAAAAGGGFLSYVDHSGSGLANQGWKDSGDSVRFADGRLAGPPVALAEVQGYAHEAARGGATLLDAFGLPGGDRWRAFAADLEGRFRARFWTVDDRGPYPAMALDGSGRRVDAVASNMAHLLGTGLLDADESAVVAARLAAPDMSDAFGLRTMSSRAGGFGALRYHCGAVWPHDTAIAVTGLVRAGKGEAAAGLVEGLLAASAAFDGRLPELWGGDARDRLPAPVPYPAACRPQAWSAASAVGLVSSVLGLAPDVPGGRLVVRPVRPSPVGALAVEGLQVAGERLDVAVDRDGRVESVRAAAGLSVEESAAVLP